MVNDNKQKYVIGEIYFYIRNNTALGFQKYFTIMLSFR